VKDFLMWVILFFHIWLLGVLANLVFLLVNPSKLKWGKYFLFSLASWVLIRFALEEYSENHLEKDRDKNIAKERKL
jgi:hypothetical protein